MGTIAAEKDRLVKHREDFRLKQEQLMQEKLHSMGRDVLELWDALNTTHLQGIHLSEREIDETFPDILKDFLRNETGKRQGNLKYVVYPRQDGDVPMVVLGMVDENHVFDSERYFVAGFAFSVSGDTLSLEAHTLRGVDRTTKRKEEAIMSDLKDQRLVVMYGVSLLLLAQRGYVDAVRTEAGPAHATGGVSGG